MSKQGIDYFNIVITNEIGCLLPRIELGRVIEKLFNSKVAIHKNRGIIAITVSKTKREAFYS